MKCKFCILSDMKKFQVPKVIQEFSAHFKAAGFSLYIVGGAVRDYLLGIPNNDYDFCTDALPQEVISLFPKVIPTGIKHGTVTVLYKGNSFEVTTFRTESDYSDSRHPDKVNFVRNLDEDLSRRDFTINALASDCNDGTIVDLFNGFEDLKNKTIRAIGNPEDRFTEDALRMMRMARFCAKLDFRPEPQTILAALNLSSRIVNVSNERIYDELSKTLMCKVPSIGLEILFSTGILNHILPEVTKCALVKQDKVDQNTVLEHLFKTVDIAASYGYDSVVRTACLLHDIGKPKAMRENDGAITFYGHDRISSEMSRIVLRRLKCSNQFIDDVSLLIANHMTIYNSTWTDGAIKRLLNRIGRENLERFYELKWCDAIATCGRCDLNETDELTERIKAIENQPMGLKDLAVTGEDLSSIGIPKSREMGIVLNSLLEMVLDDPSINDKKTLLEKARLLYDQLSSNPNSFQAK